ncbi:MAG: V-type ATPase subunit [Candidatus Aenigmarchaeota archaeon]|nr:V-type ATPase subunit [Candidatus Aenigmarchaeota archaeon]
MKIPLGTRSYERYPYTVTRIKVMKSLLLKKADYLKMSAMGYHEIAKTLEEGQYHEDVAKLAGRYAGVELLERALTENFARTLNKMMFIAHKKEVKELIETYTCKWVFSNLKLLMKQRMNMIAEQELEKLLISVEPLDATMIHELQKAPLPVLTKKVSMLSGIPERTVRTWCEQKQFLEMENGLDKAYYEKLKTFAKSKKLANRDPLKQFFIDSIALLNIKTILRSKAKQATSKKIHASLIALDETHDLEERLIAAPDINSALFQLKKTKWKVIGDDRIAKDLSMLETRSEEFLYQYGFTLLHRKPLSVAPIFGFMLLKEIELRNLRFFIHAKSLGLEKLYIEQNIIGG